MSKWGTHGQEQDPQRREQIEGGRDGRKDRGKWKRERERGDDDEGMM